MPEDFTALTAFAHLGSLDVESESLTENTLDEVQLSSRLRVLRIFRAQIGDRGMQWVAGHRNLSQLELYELDVSDEGITAIASLPQLRRLTFTEMRISDRSIPTIASMRTLESVEFNWTDVSEEGYLYLERERPDLSLLLQE